MTTTTASMQLLHNMSVAHHPLVFSALVSPAAVLHSVRVPRLHGQGLHVSGAAAEGDTPPAVLIIETDTQMHHGCDMWLAGLYLPVRGLSVEQGIHR